MLKLIFGIAFVATISSTSFAQGSPGADGAPTLRVTTSSPEAGSLFFLAWDEGNRNNRERAAALVERAVLLDSTFAMARVLRARLTLTTGNVQARIAEMDRAVAEAERASEVEGILARAIKAVYLSVSPNMFPAAASASITGQTLTRWNTTKRSAKLIADSAARLVPGDPYIAYFITALTDSNRFDAELAAVAQKFPTFPMVHHTIALRKQIAGDTVGAEREVREYLRLAPALAHAHYSYGLLLSQMKRYADARPHYADALRLDSTVAAHWEGMGTTLAQLGDYPGAVLRVRRAIQIEPAATARYRVLANIHLGAGQPDSAIAEYRRAIASNPSYANSYSGIAAIYIKQEKFAEAEGAYRQQADLAATAALRAAPLSLAALVQVTARRPLDAVITLERAAIAAQQIAPDVGVGALQYRDMALIEAAFGDRVRARTFLDKWVTVLNFASFTSGAPPGAPAILPRPEQTAPPLRAVTLTLAMLGSVQEAKNHAVEFQLVAALAGAVEQAQYHEIMAVIAVAEGDSAVARRHVDLGGEVALLGRAMYAEELKRAGRTAEVLAIKDELLKAPVPFTLNAYYAIALAKARGL